MLKRHKGQICIWLGAGPGPVPSSAPSAGPCGAWRSQGPGARAGGLGTGVRRPLVVAAPSEPAPGGGRGAGAGWGSCAGAGPGARDRQARPDLCLGTPVAPCLREWHEARRGGLRALAPGPGGHGAAVDGAPRDAAPASAPAGPPVHPRPEVSPAPAPWRVSQPQSRAGTVAGDVEHPPHHAPVPCPRCPSRTLPAAGTDRLPRTRPLGGLWPGQGTWG